MGTREVLLQVTQGLLASVKDSSFVNRCIQDNAWPLASAGLQAFLTRQLNCGFREKPRHRKHLAP